MADCLYSCVVLTDVKLIKKMYPQVKVVEQINNVQRFFATVETHEKWISQVDEVVCNISEPSKVFSKVAQQVSDCKVGREIAQHNTTNVW